MSLVLGSTSVALVQGFELVALGQDSSYGLEKYSESLILVVNTDFGMNLIIFKLFHPMFLHRL